MIFEKIIEKITQERKKENKEEKGLTCSTAGHPCLRYLWYKHNKQEPQIEPELDVIFWEGTLYHREIYNYLAKIGIEILGTDGKKYEAGKNDEVHFKVNDNFILKGHIDGLIKINDEIMLYEFKTISQRGFYRDKIDMQYLIQANLYVYALKQEGRDIQKIFFLLKNKNTPVFKEVIIPSDVSLIRETRKKLNYIINSYLIPPFRLPLKWGYLCWECSYCVYRDICWGKENLEQTGRKRFRIKGIKKDVQANKN